MPIIVISIVICSHLRSWHFWLW